MKIAPFDKSKLAKTGQEYLDLMAGNADCVACAADDVRQLREAGEGLFGNP